MKDFIDLQSGEIVHTTKRKQFVTPSCKECIGVDTKYPINCTDKKELFSILSNLDGHLSWKPTIDHAYLVDSLTGGFLTSMEVVVLQYLAKNLVAWNYWIGDKTDIACITTARNLARVLKSLSDKGAIRVLHENRPLRGNLTLVVNPVIGFKGSHKFKFVAIETWYTV